MKSCEALRRSRISSYASQITDHGSDNSEKSSLTPVPYPFREDREFARRLIGPDRFLEIYTGAPLDVCKKRDPHGIYTKAEKGEIKGVTGIDSPYEPPETPDIVMKMEEIVVGEMLSKIFEKLSFAGYVYSAD